MVKGEGLQVLHERMKTVDPDQNEIYKFLGVEQADGIKTKEVYNRVREEVSRRMKIITKTGLNDKNLIRAINTKVILVAAYPMNVCKFTESELTELDQDIKRELRKNNMLGRQASNERLYMKRSAGGRGLKSLRDVYEESRLRVACYMSINRWIKADWKRETMKENNSIKDEAIMKMQSKEKTVEFEGESIILEGNTINNLLWYTAVVMRAWRVILSAVNFTLVVNFFRYFSLFPDYLLYQNCKLIRWSKTKLKWGRC